MSRRYVRGWLSIVIAATSLASAACNRRADDAPLAQEHMAVPGVRTAAAEEASVRDSISAFAVIAPEIDAPEVRDARAALSEAEARLRAATDQLHRVEALVPIAPRKELEAARAETASATAARDRAKAAFAAFGDGGAGTALGTGEVWAIAYVMQEDIARCARGSEVGLVADAFAKRLFTGTIEGPPSYVDPISRLAPVPLRIADRDNFLRPGMTASASISAPRRTAVVVPRTAVVVDGRATVVFVERAPGDFEAQPVTPGAVIGNRVEIRDGLAKGARVAVTGASSLLSATRTPLAEED
jgi:hypothetical protein